MSKELYLMASIKEISTGRLITADSFDFYFDCGDSARVISSVWCGILEKYIDLSELKEKREAEIPKAALREMTSCLFSFAVMPECVRFEEYDEKGFWDTQNRGRINDIPYKHKPDYYDEDEWAEIDNDKKYQWDFMQEDEDSFLRKAMYLRSVIYLLDRIHFENRYEPVETIGGSICNAPLFPDSFIEEEKDLKAFKENPKGYEWRFIIFDSQ